jgi:hypothetical protein
MQQRCVPQRDSIGLHNEGGRREVLPAVPVLHVAKPVPLFSLQLVVCNRLRIRVVLLSLRMIKFIVNFTIGSHHGKPCQS